MKKIVTHPEHYNQGKIESLEFLTDRFGMDYLMGQICKYAIRAGKKDDTIQDLEKIIFYAKWAIEQVNAHHNNRESCKPNDLFPTRIFISEYNSEAWEGFDTASIQKAIVDSIVKEFTEIAPLTWVNKKEVKFIMETR